MMFDVPWPGIYGLVQPDGELRLWRNRGRDSTRTWPIWDDAATPGRAMPGRPDFPIRGWQLPANSAELDLDRTWARERAWRPVRFGVPYASGPTWYDVFASLHAEVDTRVWWTDRERAHGRRALYMPAMPREDLIMLVRNLEERSNAGGKRINKAPIGVWVRRMWDVIERRERGDLMGVSP